MTMREKEGESGTERVVVVLDAFRTSTERGGVAPLRYTIREVVRQNDEVLVLTIVDSGANESPLTSVGCCCSMIDGRFDQFSSEGDSYISVVHEEISQRKDAFAQIFRPYYDICKSRGVKFQVKIAASFQPQTLVVEEANNVNATWIVMDRCFSREQSLQMNGTQCNVVLVNCDEKIVDEKIVAHKNLPLKDAAEISVVQLQKHFPNSTNPDKQNNLAEESHFDYRLPSFQIQYVPFPPLNSTSKEFGESSNKSKSPRKNGELTSTVNLGTRMPLQLSWEMIEEITCGFTRMTCVDETKSFKSYCGYLSDHHSQVLVKRFSFGQFDDVLEAEKKAASSMYHKNILGLIGYHKSDYAMVLVHPFSRRGTLDKFLHGSKGRQVKLIFQEKIDIAIRIGQGVRYMHEECPRGPIVHRDLRPCNILMKADLEPLITGFGKAKWLQLDRASPISSNRFRLKNPSDIEALALVKSDIFQFGILLLRLFCRRFAPHNDEIFLEWARPLLKQMAYHELLEEDVEYQDTYGVMRVMWASAQCIEPRPISRPNISEVISLLKGETSCAVPLSPSSEGSPNADLCSFNLSPYKVVNTVKEYS